MVEVDQDGDGLCQRPLSWVKVVGCHCPSSYANLLVEEGSVALEVRVDVEESEVGT